MKKIIKLYGELNEKATVVGFNEIFSQDKFWGNVIEIDISDVVFVKPSGISMLYNICKWIKDKNIDISFKFQETDIKVLKYLDDSKFFEMVIGKQIFEESRVRDTTLPVKNLAISSTFDWLHSTFNAWMANQLECEVDQLNNLEILLLELFNNTRDHSEKDFCCTYSQHYPSKNTIEIGIGDIGIGIPNNIKNVFTNMNNDVECIKKALNRGITTKTKPSNRGEGLYILKSYILTEKIGVLTIISGKGYYKLWPNESVHEEVLDFSYPGTFINLEINTTNIKGIFTDVNEEGMSLEW